MEFDTTITHIGADSFEAPTPVSGEEIPELEEAFDSLKANTYDDAMKNSNVFVGVSVANCVTKEMVKSMNDKLIILDKQ